MAEVWTGACGCKQCMQHCVNVFVTIITIIDEVRAGASGCKQCTYVACSAAVRADKTSSLCAQTRLHSTQRGVA